LQLRTPRSGNQLAITRGPDQLITVLKVKLRTQGSRDDCPAI